MIDASRSPRPAWQRYATFVAIAALLVVAVFVIWTKELHHSSPAAAPQTPALTVPAHTAVQTAGHTPKPATTVPGGLPISSRNPFQG